MLRHKPGIGRTDRDHSKEPRSRQFEMDGVQYAAASPTAARPKPRRTAPVTGRLV